MRLKIGMTIFILLLMVQIFAISNSSRTNTHVVEVDRTFRVWSDVGFDIRIKYVYDLTFFELDNKKLRIKKSNFRDFYCRVNSELTTLQDEALQLIATFFEPSVIVDKDGEIITILDNEIYQDGPKSAADSIAEVSIVLSELISEAMTDSNDASEVRMSRARMNWEFSLQPFIVGSFETEMRVNREAKIVFPGLPGIQVPVRVNYKVEETKDPSINIVSIYFSNQSTDKNGEFDTSCLEYSEQSSEVITFYAIKSSISATVNKSTHMPNSVTSESGFRYKLSSGMDVLYYDLSSTKYN